MSAFQIGTVAPAFLKRMGRMYYGWWIVASNSAISFVGGFHFNGGSVYFLPLTESLKLSRAQLSFVFAAARLEGGIEGPAIGWLIDRIGTRKLILAGGVLVGVGYILLGTVVHSFPALFVIYVVLISTGASAGFFAPLMAAINTWFSRRRTLALSVQNTFSRGSGFIVTPLLSFLVLAFGWRNAAVISGIVILVVVLPVALLHRPSPEQMGLRPDGDPPEGPGAGYPAATGRGMARGRTQGHEFLVREALRTRTFWQLTVAQALRILVQGGLYVHLIPIFVWKGMERQAAANLLGLMAVVGIPAVLFFGWAGDRFSKKLVITIGASAGAGAVAVLALGTEPWHLYPFIVLNGLADASFPVIVSLSGDYFGRRSFATIRGISQFFTALGVFCTTIFAGWVWDRTGSYTLAIAPLTAVAALSIPLFLTLQAPKPPRRDVPAQAAASVEQKSEGGATSRS